MDPEDDEGEFLSLLGARLTSLTDLALASTLRTLVLHANEISRIEGLGHLSGLTELNLSSNRLERLDGLGSLASLRSLNLSSNRISSMEPESLAGMASLETLALAHNCLDGEALAGLGSGASTLRTLDLRNNRINDLTGLGCLRGLQGLRSLLLAGGSPGNGLCRLQDYRVAVLAVLTQLTALDGVAVPGARPSPYPAAMVPLPMSRPSMPKPTPSRAGIQRDRAPRDPSDQHFQPQQHISEQLIGAIEDKIAAVLQAHLPAAQPGPADAAAVQVPAHSPAHPSLERSAQTDPDGRTQLESRVQELQHEVVHLTAELASKEAALQNVMSEADSAVHEAFQQAKVGIM